MESISQLFNEFSSNTISAAGNQLVFSTAGETVTGRVFYKIRTGGTYAYAFLFSSTVDSTYADGSRCHSCFVCDEWTVESLRVGVCRACSMTEMPANIDFISVLFDGKPYKNVAPGEFFRTDAVPITARAGEYLCLEIAFRGDCIPYHEETMLPVFRYENGAWNPKNTVPLAGFVGCRRPVQTRVGFLGDSITQGCGTQPNTYTYWAAKTADAFGDEVAFWNLGLGYGRGADTGKGGAWLWRAKHNDVVVVCFGVNDILQGYPAEEIKKNLFNTVRYLHDAGVRVVIQSVPPFDYDEPHTVTWKEVNRYIKEELAPMCAGYFDTVAVLCADMTQPQFSRFGGHPNAEGCAKWAESLVPVLRNIIKE